MRQLVIGGLTMLAACTLLVPIDDDVSNGVAASDGGSKDDGGGAARDGAVGAGDAGADAPPPYDSGEPFGPAREGCPNGVSLDTELEAYYPFDETEGSVLHDCSQKAHDLKSLSTAVPKWVPDGHIRGAADFDGIDGCFGSGDYNLDKFEGQPFTISIWVLTRQYYEASKTGRWAVGHKTSPHGWHIGVDDPNRFELDLEWVEGSTQKKTQISGAIELDTWTHFVTTYSDKGEATVYKNGVLTDKQNTAGKVPASFGTGTDAFLRIGCRGPSSGMFDGRLDELRIYPRVITEEQIRKLAEAR